MYLLILRRNQDQDLPIADREMKVRFMSWTKSLQQRGVLQAVERLKPASEAVTLRLCDGQPVAEGRYSASEDCIGYYLLNVEDLEAARAMAEDCPILAAGGSVEIRQTEPFGPPSGS